MGTEPLTAVLRALPVSRSRRGVLVGLCGGLFSALPVLISSEVVEARKAKKRKKHKKQSATPMTPATPATKVDATCSGPDHSGFSGFDGDYRFAQTFTALANGPLVRAELSIYKLGGSGGSYILRLSPVDGAGVPTNTVLASASIPNVSVPEGITTLTFTFADPASVVAGAQYALVLTRPGSNQIAWSGHVDGTCSGSKFSSQSQTAAFLASADGVNFNFTTFVTS